MATQWKPPITSAKQPKSSALPWKPLGYMRKAVKFLLSNGSAALFLEPGLRKTSITLATLKVLKKEQQMRAAVVFAPLRAARQVWPAEARKWKDFHDLSVGLLWGDKKDRVLAEDHDIYVVNYEGIPWLFNRRKVGKAWKYELTPAGKVLMGKVNVVVFDELHKMKHSETLRYKLLRPHLNKFDRRYGLTGSPAANGLLDLFGQCFVLDGGNALGQYVTHYREQYFTEIDHFTWVLKPGAEKLIHNRLRPLALSMQAADHLELPTERVFPTKLDWPNANVRKMYDEMEEDFLTTLDTEVFTAPNSAAAGNKCRQICSGAVYSAKVDLLTGIKTTGPQKWSSLHDVKLDYVEDLLEELQGQQVLLGYEFKFDIERLVKRFPKMHYFGMPKRKDAWLEDAWNAGEIPFLAGQSANISEAMNLQGSNAHNLLLYGIPWDYKTYYQLVRRLLRSGNTADYVNVYMPIMRDSVEEYVATVLRKKGAVENDFRVALKSRAKLAE